MNTSQHKHPRFVCRFVRWWFALTESGARSVEAAPVSGHRADCPDCRAHFRSQATIEAQLRRDAPTARPATPAGLELRIAEAVRHAHAAVPRARRRPRSAVSHWAGGLGAATAAAILLVLLNRGSTPSTGSAKVDPAEITAVFNAVATLPNRLGSLLPPAPHDNAAPDPLDHELDNVKADARSALRFLAENFLPAAHRDPTSPVQARQPTIEGT